MVIILGILTISLAVLFLILYRTGVLDDLADSLSGPEGRRSHPMDPEEERRLEVYKEFFEEDSEND